MPDSISARTAPGAVAGLVGTATVLGLLYFGRDVLIPITLAFILSFLIAPLVRKLRKLGLGPTASVGTGVLALTVALGLVGAVLVTQVGKMAASLPLYQDNIAAKIDTLNQLSRGAVDALGGPAGQLIDHFSQERDSGFETGAMPGPGLGTGATAPVLVEIHEPALKPFQVLSRVVASVWPPLETAGIVFVVLIFVLLEHESLRDRFIRLAGGSDLRATTLAVNDAGERLSRFFISQFAVNAATGVAIWVGLSLLGLSQAPLWGTMAAILRFIPYVGVWIAAFCATLLAAAVDPGWSLALMTVGLFLVVEIVVAQTIEPKLYGHSTGLSPLSVVVTAIFWSWIWGPVGLVVSTPLTLCLVVAGRYIPALNILEIMFGELPALTMPQNFYQRALSGDAEELVASARRYMRRKSLATYCDAVLLPALHLASFDLRDQAISKDEQLKVVGAIIAVIEALSARPSKWRKKKHVSVLTDVSIGRQLRDRRESHSGQWQGSLDVPPGSVVLGVGLGSRLEELAAEILVRILHEQKLDGRHIVLSDLDVPRPPEATPDLVSIVCVVCAEPQREQQKLELAIAELRRHFPRAQVLAVLLPSPFENQKAGKLAIGAAHHVVHSYDETLHSCRKALKTAA